MVLLLILSSLFWISVIVIGVIKTLMGKNFREKARAYDWKDEGIEILLDVTEEEIGQAVL
jgi:hypothetical protein